MKLERRDRVSRRSKVELFEEIRNESEYRRYQRTAQRISSGSVCRHLKIAGRIIFFMISSSYQPPSAKVATQP